MNFTFREYQDILISILENNYDFASYENHDKVSNPCILRHDVDYSLDRAAKMSAVEAAFVKEAAIGHIEKFSTYFVLLKSKFYNIHTKASLTALNNILENGSNIGLHFDQRAYETSGMDALIEYAENEAFFLGRILGSTISVVSMHCPTRMILDSDIQFGTLINSYSKMFFNEFKYISDSSMSWRENPFETIKSQQFKKLHILTHAFWYTEKQQTKENKVLDFIKEASYERFEEYCTNEPDMRNMLINSMLTDHRF